MAATAATLAFFTAKDLAYSHGGQAREDKLNGNLHCLRFAKGTSNGSGSYPHAVEFQGVIPGPAATFFSSTTGIKAIIGWAAVDKVTTGAVRWSAELYPLSQTDLPDPTVVPWNATYEISATGTVNATTAGGMVYTPISLTIANIQHGGTTAPAIYDAYRLRIQRRSENSADTIVGDALLCSVELRDY